MKTLFIIGALLLFFGIAFGVIVGSKNSYEKLSESGIRIVRASILIGFALMILSGIIYFKS